MTLSKEIIEKEFRKNFEEAYKKIDTLTPEERLIQVNKAKEYYEYLTSNGILYGNLALEVVEDKGMYGRIANIHLRAQSIFEGIDSASVSTMREKLIISLAYRDMDMRVKQVEIGNPNYKEIEDYHVEEFRKYTTPYAWGGLVMKELVGSESWMEFYEKDASILNKAFLEGTIKALKARSETVVSEYSAERMIAAAGHAFGEYTTGTSSEFRPIVSAQSKEIAARMWKIAIDRLEEIPHFEFTESSTLSKVFYVNSATMTLVGDEIYIKEHGQAGLCAASAAGGGDTMLVATLVHEETEEEHAVISTILINLLYSGEITKAIALILSGTIDINEKSSDDSIALHVAAREGLDEVVTLLLNHGALKDARDKDGMTPLHHAAFSSEVNSARILLEAGVDIKVLDLLGRSALHYGCASGPQSMVDLLVSYGFQMDFKDNYGETPSEVFQKALTGMLARSLYEDMTALGMNGTEDAEIE